MPVSEHMDGYEIASFDGLHICLIPQNC